MSFEKNVFVNCPFDDEYLPLLRATIFTILYLGFEPRIALESIDSGIPRIQKIIELIYESKFGIHDLSRSQSTKIGEFFRLNMPFELGIDVGCRAYKGDKWSEKRCLILESERYRHQATLSDMSNSDIGVHSNQPDKVVKEIRDWLNIQNRLNAVGPSQIWAKFNEFMAYNFDILRERGFSKNDIEARLIPELIQDIKTWQLS